MVMIVNSGRWCLGFIGNDGFTEQLKLWLRIHGEEELQIHMLTKWLIFHHVRGVAWRSKQCAWFDWRAWMIVWQFNRQMQDAGMKCTVDEVILEMDRKRQDPRQ